MDDFGQIIGFIIAAIFFIASAIKKKNKKNAPAKKSNNFTDVLESFLGEQTTPHSEEEYVEAYIEPEIQEKPIMQAPKQTTMFKKSESTISMERVHNSFKQEKKINVIKPKNKTHINLRQAVIYSEILNRKEF